MWSQFLVVRNDFNAYFPITYLLTPMFIYIVESLCPRFIIVHVWVFQMYYNVNILSCATQSLIYYFRTYDVFHALVPIIRVLHKKSGMVGDEIFKKIMYLLKIDLHP